MCLAWNRHVTWWVLKGNTQTNVIVFAAWFDVETDKNTNVYVSGKSPFSEYGYQT
jgi:hypothetical protein